MNEPVMTTLEIIEPGLSTTFQDLGRDHLQYIGVSLSGAMDRFACRLTEALLNDHSTTLEFTMVGPTFKVVGADISIAVVGDCSVKINGEALQAERSFQLKDGDTICVGALKNNRFGYIGIAGYPDFEPTFESWATHLGTGLGGFNGRSLKGGDALSFLWPRLEPNQQLPQRVGKVSSPLPVRFIAGPQDDHFSLDEFNRFCDETYTVSQLSDRQGYRLDGAKLTHLPEKGADIISDGIVLGSIQVPGDGNPILLMADHHTMGGYPKIGTVVEPDASFAAQLRPGEALQFLPVGLDEAREYALDIEREQRELVEMIKPVPKALDLSSEALLSANLISGVISDG